MSQSDTPERNIQARSLADVRRAERRRGTPDLPPPPEHDAAAMALEHKRTFNMPPLWRIPLTVARLTRAGSLVENQSYYDITRPAGLGYMVTIEDSYMLRGSTRGEHVPSETQLVYPGQALICNRPDGNQLYIVLPGGAWYPVDETVTVVADGWLVSFNTRIAPWMELTYAERIARCCREALHDIYYVAAGRTLDGADAARWFNDVLRELRDFSAQAHTQSPLFDQHYPQSLLSTVAEILGVSAEHFAARLPVNWVQRLANHSMAIQLTETETDDIRPPVEVVNSESANVGRQLRKIKITQVRTDVNERSIDQREVSPDVFE